MKKKIVIGGFCFFIGATVAFFAVQFFTKTGIFKVPGALIFDETVSEADIAMFREAIGDIELEQDVTFSESFSDSYNGGMLVDVFVPVADFYEAREEISTQEFEAKGFYRCLNLTRLKNC